MTSEQLQASRSERMRLNGHGPLTFEDARTWIEETGLCLFLPRRQYSASVAPSFVEAVAGEQNSEPNPKQIALAEELLVRLERNDVAVRLNLLGQPGEQPDFVVAAWVLPYVYALRGDRDWRRSPQLTGSRQVSPLAVQAYKLLESKELTISELKHALGREVTEVAVIRAITELWQQLRIIPIVSAPGEAARWQLLRVRFQKAIAEGASTSQVTAISVLASIYLQAVIAASMEEVELFLAPLTARSKIREVLRGLVATRQVHTISMNHAPHFYVAGTLPEFGVQTTIYSSAAFESSPYFRYRKEREEEAFEPAPAAPAPVSLNTTLNVHVETPENGTASTHVQPHAPANRKPAAGKPAQARPHFSRASSHGRDRKATQSTSNGRVARRAKPEGRSANAGAGSRNGNGSRWKTAPSNGSSRNGTHSATPSSPHNGHSNGHSNGNGTHRSGSAAASRSTKPQSSSRSARSSAKPVAKAGTAAISRKPALTAGSKAGNTKRYGFSAVRSGVRPGQGTKKRG